jgi:hypothetical protein
MMTQSRDKEDSSGDTPSPIWEEGVKSIPSQSVDGLSALAWALSPLSGAGTVNLRTVCPNCIVAPGPKRPCSVQNCCVILRTVLRDNGRKGRHAKH